MKKLILLALLAVIMAECDCERGIPNKSQKADEIYNVFSYEIDSCEYIKQGHGLSHKGNCKYCAARRKAELKELVECIKTEKE